MGSHWVIFADFDKHLSRNEIRVLSSNLEKIDWDFDESILYRDGIRGTWRNPINSALIIEQLSKYSSNILFKPFKCDDFECSCHTFEKGYGCSLFNPEGIIWDKNGLKQFSDIDVFAF